MQTPLDIFARAVRDAREKQNLTQKDLAEKLGMNTHTILELEMGRSNPRAETVLLIAAELHISLDAILYSSTMMPNAVDVEVLDFFSGKNREEARDYIGICHQIEAIGKKD